MKRVLVSALSSASLIASPVAGQSLTLGNLKAPIARASGQTPAKSIKDLWVQINALPTAKPPVGDAAEPELGANLDKMPAIVPSNVDISSLLVPAWGTGALPGSSAGEGVGAFRFVCGAGQVAYNDPIVFPGQPGKSHLHQFFGNLSADAYSTYGSLRAKGDSTCSNPLIRGAYWVPAMLDGKGNVVRVDYVTGYYKNFPRGSADCARIASSCAQLPRGLREIFGYDMVAGNPPTGSGTFSCDGPTAKPGSYRTIAEAAKGCPAGNRLIATLTGPNCWDNKHLDSADHRSHLAYASYPNGAFECPKTHPVLIPAIGLNLAWYVTDDASGWYLSSDDMTAMGMGRLPGGTTLHADAFPAFDDTVLDTLTRYCLDGLKSCNGGDLGNGTQLKDITSFDWQAHPRLVPIPERVIK